MLGHAGVVKVKNRTVAAAMRARSYPTMNSDPKAAPSNSGLRAPAGARPADCGHDEMTAAKLWDNPCWLSYRLNYLALRYNVPLYSWVEKTYGLSRPQYVVIYSLGLKDGAVARDIATSSGFPQNTLSRAIHGLVGRGLVARRADRSDRRRMTLTLTAAGQALFEESLPRFVALEHTMLEALSEAERATLSALMAKMVLAARDWPSAIEPDVAGDRQPN